MKKFICFILSLSVVCALCACSKKDDDSTTKTAVEKEVQSEVQSKVSEVVTLENFTSKVNSDYRAIDYKLGENQKQGYDLDYKFSINSGKVITLPAKYADFTAQGWKIKKGSPDEKIQPKANKLVVLENNKQQLSVCFCNGGDSEAAVKDCGIYQVIARYSFGDGPRITLTNGASTDMDMKTFMETAGNPKIIEWDNISDDCYIAQYKNDTNHTLMQITFNPDGKIRNLNYDAVRLTNNVN